jgi:NAD(P)-dependent dehydrogenase (short-subunit alcohol dehydrogenase family)
MAVAFAEEGANAGVAGRRENEGAESIKLVEKAGGNGLFVRTNVTVEKEVEAMAARTVGYFGAPFTTGAALSVDGGIVA